MNEAQQTRLSLVFITGVNEEGKNITKTKSFSNVKGSATDESLVALTNALASLQQHPLADSVRNNHYSVI